MIPFNSVPPCLENFIGVRCLTTNPTSGLWINDLPGINLGYAADIVDRGGMSGLQFLQEKIDFATRLVVQELSGAALPYFRMNSIIDQVHAGEWKSTFIAPANIDRGVKITANKSRLLRVRVNNVKIKIQQANYSGNIKCDDGVSFTLFPFTTDANGEAEIFPNYLSNTKDLWVLLNDNGINVNNSEVKTGCGCSSKASRYMTATGWNGSGLANSTYGLQVDATAECSYDEFACIISAKLPFLILYKAGIEIIKEAITTDRLNSITLLDTDKAQFMLSDFTKEYDKHSKMLIDSLPELFKRVDDCCIMCNQAKYVIGRP